MAFRTPALLPAALTLLLAAPAHPQSSSAFQDRARPRTATVTILALSSVAHTGFSGNEDIYLADILFKQGEHQNVRLVDFYPAISNPIRHTLLTDRRTFHMRLIRAPECDEVTRNILVATRDENIFDATTRSTLAAQPEDSVVPCYKVVHEATRLIKK